MKTSIILFLIFISFTYQEPADERRANSNGKCEIDTEGDKNSLSECVDLKLEYTDNKCCFMRYQKEGEIFKSCIPLREEEYLDIVETKKRIEEGFYKILYKGQDEGRQIKVYELDCSASSLKFLTFASILLALLF